MPLSVSSVSSMAPPAFSSPKPLPFKFFLLYDVDIVRMNNIKTASPFATAMPSTPKKSQCQNSTYKAHYCPMSNRESQRESIEGTGITHRFRFLW